VLDLIIVELDGVGVALPLRVRDAVLLLVGVMLPLGECVGVLDAVCDDVGLLLCD
jgi:hypothetical protein